MPAHKALLSVWSAVLREALQLPMSPGLPEPPAAAALPALPMGSADPEIVQAWRLALRLMSPPSPSAAAADTASLSCGPSERRQAGGPPPPVLCAGMVLALLRLAVQWDVPGLAAHCQDLLLSGDVR